MGERASFTEVVSLEDVNNGAVGELFQEEFKKLLKNLADENTSWKTQRGVTINLKVKLNSEVRDSATTLVEVTTKLAPPKANEAIVYLDTDGRDVFCLAKKNDPKQMELDNITNIEEGAI